MRTQPGQSEDRARQSMASGDVRWLIIQLDQIGAYQRPCHAGVEMCGNTSGISGNIG
jgi:hypothetical protein